MEPSNQIVPYGFCHCGCGQKTLISPKTDRKWGWVKGQPKRFLYGHQNGNPRSTPMEVQDGVYAIDLLNQNRAIVDEDDLCFLTERKWVKSHWGYAVSRKPKGGIDFMHRLILNAAPSDEVDHINGNKLDNRRCNLRFCTHSENMRNRPKPRHNVSGAKGVRFYKGAWTAAIKTKLEQVHIGRFPSKREAILAYNNAAILHHGEFAVLNEVPVE